MRLGLACTEGDALRGTERFVADVRTAVEAETPELRCHNVRALVAAAHARSTGGASRSRGRDEALREALIPD